MNRMNKKLLKEHIGTGWNMFVATLGGEMCKTMQTIVTVMSKAESHASEDGMGTRQQTLRRSGFYAAQCAHTNIMIGDEEPGGDFEVLAKRPRRVVDDPNTTNPTANTDYAHFLKFEKLVPEAIAPAPGDSVPCDDASAVLLDPFCSTAASTALFGPDAPMEDVWDPLLPGRDIEAETTSLSDIASTAATSDLFTPPMTPPLLHVPSQPEFPPVPRGGSHNNNHNGTVSIVTAMPEPRPTVPFLSPSSASQAMLNVLTSRAQSLAELADAAAGEQRDAAGALAQLTRHRRHATTTTTTHEEQCARLEKLVARRGLLLEEGEQVCDAAAALFDTSVLAPTELACWAELGALLRRTLAELAVHNAEAHALIQQQQQQQQKQCGTDSALVLMLPVLKRSVMKGNTMLFTLADVRPLGCEDKDNTAVSVDAVVEGGAKKDSLDVVFQGTQVRTTGAAAGGAGQVVVSVRCPAGSNKRPVRLLFSGAAEGHGRAALSDPVIVVTNSAQWHDAEGILLSRELFGDYAAVTWAHFCNTLQWWMVDATKQRLGDPRRALTAPELAYLGTKAHVTYDTTCPNSNGNSNSNSNSIGSVAARNWETFWGFFGACMEKLRHQRNLTPMWQRGLIMGFGTKADAARLLAQQPDGAFVVRFSDTFPGVFAADFVFGGSVHHVLIKDHDASGSKRSVMEFLHDAPYLTQVVTVVPSPLVSDRLVAGPLVSKTAILREFFLTRPLRGQNSAAPQHGSSAARYEDADAFLLTLHPSAPLSHHQSSTLSPSPPQQQQE